MPYFRRFPLMAYDIKGNKQYKLLPDILRRVKLRTGIRNGSFLFDKYNYQWPMTQPQFEEFLKDKYGAGSEDGIHHYEITQTSGRQSGQGAADFSHKVEVNSDEEGAVSISNRQYEERLQEQYSQIRLLDTRYLVPFIEEFDRLIKQEA